MILSDKTGARLLLQIDGYYNDDGDWLRIHMEATTPRGAWEATDSCLTMMEAEQLIKWLREIADDKVLDSTLSFTEGHLEFKFWRRTEDVIQLSVYLGMEFSPPWFAEDHRTGQFPVDVSVSPSDVSNAADQLEDERNKLQTRGA